MDKNLRKQMPDEFKHAIKVEEFHVDDTNYWLTTETTKLYFVLARDCLDGEEGILFVVYNHEKKYWKIVFRKNFFYIQYKVDLK